MAAGKGIVTVDGVEYKSGIEYVRQMLAKNPEANLNELAKKVGITYSTAYAYTRGMEKRKEASLRRRVCKLGLKHSIGKIAKDTELHPSKVQAMLKKAGITPVKATTEKKHDAPVKAVKKASKKSTKKVETPAAPVNETAASETGNTNVPEATAA